MDEPVAGIGGISDTLGDRAVDLKALEAAGLIESGTNVLTDFGFRSVRVSDRPADELALDALRDLLDAHQIEAESVDGLIYAGAIPQSHRVTDGSHLEGFNYPVARLQYECGLTNAITLGVAETGCTGLMAAVALAADHLAAHPLARRMICVSSDVLPGNWTREIIYNVVSAGAFAHLIFLTCSFSSG